MCNMSHIKVIILLCVLTVFPLSFGIAIERDPFTPWDFNQSSPRSVSEHVIIKNDSVPSYLLKSSVEFFKNYISRVDGDRCQMHPTCSSYSLQAIDIHGFIVGIVMTADRLIHESNEMDYAPLIRVVNRFRYYDPICNNDFWWYQDDTFDK
jgi:hypothetical protein